MKVLLLTKANDYGREAQTIAQRLFRHHDLTMIEGMPSGPLPDAVRAWSGRLILSFCCPWILPAEVLAQARDAINFHPAPPEHPGFAPYSWAIYHEDQRYGVTVHHMLPSVDTGPIVWVDRFQIGPSVAATQQIALGRLALLLTQFQAIPLTPSGTHHWTRAPRTKADFERLRVLTHEMSNDEINRRIRACDYPGQPGAEFR